MNTDESKRSERDCESEVESWRQDWHYEIAERASESWSGVMHSMGRLPMISIHKSYPGRGKSSRTKQRSPSPEHRGF